MALGLETLSISKNAIFSTTMLSVFSIQCIYAEDMNTQHNVVQRNDTAIDI